jgi:hypothetical protein
VLEPPTHPQLKKKIAKKPGSKSSVGSNSVPLAATKDQSASKSMSAPPKFKIQIAPFNQYGSNLDEAALFEREPIL